MRTDTSNRTRIADALRPDEDLRALVQFTTVAQEATVNDATAFKKVGSPRRIYLHRAGLDLGTIHPALNHAGWIVATDRRLVVLGADLMRARPQPDRVLVEAPISDVRLNWHDLKWRGMTHRLFHLEFPDGRWNVVETLLASFIRRRPKHDEHDLLVAAFDGRATNFAPEEVAARRAW